ncbi:hypothetical protein LRS13_18005 [Svornostia abyssi]|uniref:Zinc ribbon domain-containing protein n=1 Tax=Svornostia abyssi TaxID=2898438 RepID=A0ABY5PDA4_9ACTN|nr:hypothetical protein LRS13_18005 [Parviterribacteraceae bacterium J379]
MEALFVVVFLGVAIVTIMSLISLAERGEWGWFVVGLFIPFAAIIGAMISSPTEESATHKRCPVCAAEDVPRGAMKCPHCSFDFAAGAELT